MKLSIRYSLIDLDSIHNNKLQSDYSLNICFCDVFSIPGVPKKVPLFDLMQVETTAFTQSDFCIS